MVGCWFKLFAVFLVFAVAATAAESQSIAAWDLSTLNHPNTCRLWQGALSCTVREGTPITITLPRARKNGANSESYSLVNQPAYSTLDTSTNTFTWTPFFSSRNGLIHADSGAGDHRMYFFSSYSELPNFGVYFSVEDAARVPSKLQAPLLVGAQPFYPTIAFGIPEPRIAEMHALGMNTVWTQNVGHDFEMSSLDPNFNRDNRIVSDIRNLSRSLDTAHALGMQVIVQHHVPEVVRAIKDHPALLAVALPQDEPDFALDPASPRHQDPYYSADTMRQMRDAIRAVAPNLPICAVFTARFSGSVSYAAETPSTLEGFREYLLIPDIIVFDYYLHSADGRYDIVRDARPLGGMVEEALGLVNDSKLVIPIIEATQVYASSPASEQEHPVTSNHLRPQIRSVVAGGAAGIAFYGAHYVPSRTPAHQPWDIGAELASQLPSILGALQNGVQAVDIIGEELPEAATQPHAQARVKATFDPNTTGMIGSGGVQWSLPGLDTESPSLLRCDGAASSSPLCQNLDAFMQFHSTIDTFARVAAFGSADYAAVKYFRIEGSSVDFCFDDPSKQYPGVCGCGMPDADSDEDGGADCIDVCPQDPAKDTAGACGCGTSDIDSDGDTVPDCLDACPADASTSGICPLNPPPGPVPSPSHPDTPPTLPQPPPPLTPALPQPEKPMVTQIGKRLVVRMERAPGVLYEIHLWREPPKPKQMTLLARRPTARILGVGAGTWKIRYRIISASDSSPLSDFSAAVQVIKKPAKKKA